jgi:hypothetical protein
VLWFGLHLLFLGFVSNSGFRFGNDGFAFLSSFLDKIAYSFVHRCRLWENGNAPKMSEKKIILKLKLEAPSFQTSFGPKSIERATPFLSISLCTHCDWDSFTAVHINPASVPVSVHMY